jgi:large conductance mechanosensitive channel
VKDFKAFILRGNVVDLAVGVVIGAAFGAVITSLVKDIITPLIGLFGKPDFSRLFVKVGEAKITYGNFFNALIAFLMIAAAVFFLVVKPINKLASLRKGPEEPTKKECPRCLSEIPIAATRCAFCAANLPAA